MFWEGHCILLCYKATEAKFSGTSTVLAMQLNELRRTMTKITLQDLLSGGVHPKTRLQITDLQCNCMHRITKANSGVHNRSQRRKTGTCSRRHLTYEQSSRRSASQAQCVQGEDCSPLLLDCMLRASLTLCKLADFLTVACLVCCCSSLSIGCDFVRVTGGGVGVWGAISCLADAECRCKLTRVSEPGKRVPTKFFCRSLYSSELICVSSVSFASKRPVAVLPTAR